MGTHVNTAPAASAPPAATPTRKFVFTATDASEQAYRDQKWTDELMVKHGKGKWVEVAAAPANTAPAPSTEEEPDLPF